MPVSGTPCLQGEFVGVAQQQPGYAAKKIAAYAREYWAVGQFTHIFYRHAGALRGSTARAR